jgi:hypothetical protein
MDSYIVDFAYFCHRCKHADKDVTETPCDECLDNPHSTESKRPLFFEQEPDESKWKLKSEKGKEPN